MSIDAGPLAAVCMSSEVCMGTQAVETLTCSVRMRMHGRLWDGMVHFGQLT